MTGNTGKNKKLRILIIGTLPPPLGGMTVSLSHLLSHLAGKEDLDVLVAETNNIRGEGFKMVWRFFCKVLEIVGKSFRCHVISLHLCPLAFWTMSPVVLPLAFLFRKPLLIRQMGGLGFLELNWFHRFVSSPMVHYADLFLVQTKALKTSAEKHGISRVIWYPTSRPMNAIQTELINNKCRRFVYMGHVRPYKGIMALIEAAEWFDSSILVDVYGPFLDGFDEALFGDCRRVRYKGVLAPDNIIPTVRKYDAMLLPTKAPAEGYPGAILESYAAGRPVIASRVGGIPEIVDDSSGILIPPGDAEALYQAMKRLIEDEKLYQRLCAGAAAKAKQFDSKLWADTFVTLCRNLADGKR